MFLDHYIKWHWKEKNSYMEWIKMYLIFILIYIKKKKNSEILRIFYNIAVFFY